MNQRWIRPTHAVVAIGLLPLLAGGCGSSGDSAKAREAARSASSKAAAKYREYLEENAGELVFWTRLMRNQIAVGALPQAQSRYATARVQYGQIEPAARSFEDLDARIDATAGEHADGFYGFHRVERTLFAAGTTEGARPAAERLLRDTEKLRRRLRTADLQPLRLSEDVSEMLAEVSSKKIAGEEERYSHIDLVDIAANVEGAEAAFEVVEPLLVDDEGRSLAESIKDQFAAVYASLRAYGSAAREPQTRPRAAGARFVPYDQVAGADIQDLARPIERLDQLFGQVPERVG